MFVNDFVSRYYGDRDLMNGLIEKALDRLNASDALVG